MVLPTLRTALATFVMVALLASIVGVAVSSAHPVAGHSTAIDPIERSAPGADPPPAPAQQTATESETAGTDTPADPANATVTIAAENDSPTFVTAPGQTIRGRTSLPPDTDLEVRLRSTGPVRFLGLNSTAVRDDGTFRATFNLSSVTLFEPVSVRVSVRRDGETLAAASGSLRPDNETTRTPSPDSTTSTPVPTPDGDASDTPEPGDAPEGPTPDDLLPDGDVAAVLSGAGSALAAFLLLGSTAFVLYRR